MGKGLDQMNSKMRAACAVTMMACAGVASASEACWTPKELAAARVRDLQTIMMVGALQCSAQGYNTAFGYDRFVNRHRAELVDSNDTLKHHFMRQAASSTGERDYDGFATAMANAHSARSNDMRHFCERVDSLVRTAVSVRGDELSEFAATVSERPLGVGEDCGRAMVAEADALPPPRDEARDYARVEERDYTRDDQRGDEPPRQQVAVAVTIAPPPAARVAEAAIEPAVVPAQASVAQPVAIKVADDSAVRQATAALQQATAALQAAIAAQAASQQPAVSQVSVTTTSDAQGPDRAGPRRATVTPHVLAPEPVVAPEVMQFVG